MNSDKDQCNHYHYIVILLLFFQTRRQAEINFLSMLFETYYTHTQKERERDTHTGIALLEQQNATSILSSKRFHAGLQALLPKLASSTLRWSRLHTLHDLATPG